MQDMSGFVLSDTTLPQLDEQLDLTISTAQTGNDFYVHNIELQSPGEYSVGDTSEDVINEEIDMFHNSNFEPLDFKTNEWQPESPIKRNMYDYMHPDQTRPSTNMDDEGAYISSQKLSYNHSKGKFTSTVKNEKPKYLEIIDSEEPLIKEDPDILYCTVPSKRSYCIKSEVNLSDVFSSEEPIIGDSMDRVYCSSDFKDMGVAEEVIVMTENEEQSKTNLNMSLLDSVPSDLEEDLTISEEKSKKEIVVFQSDPFSNLENLMDSVFNDLEQIDDPYSQEKKFHTVSFQEIEEDLVGHTIATDNYLLNSCADNENLFPSNLLNQTTAINSLQANNSFRMSSVCQSTSKTTSIKHNPLTLDISAARAAILEDKGISDTPELLDALKPEVGEFDLVKFITSSGDPNNNAESPPIGLVPKQPEPPRKGKSHLSLQDLKQAQTQGRGRSLSRTEEEPENKPSSSISGVSVSRRPARQSANRFKKMIEDGFLSSVTDSRSVSSDDEEEEEPKAKRRRTTSNTSSRRRLDSDSDRSSISEDAMKYRERRDRNNLSSKLSRQKRKMQHQLKEKELRELENKNAKLRLKANQLESVLTQVKNAWGDYLAHMKDDDIDKGDEHC